MATMAWQVSASRLVSSVACTRTSLPWLKVRIARDMFVSSVTSRAFITTAPTAGTFKRLLLICLQDSESAVRPAYPEF